MRMMKTELMVVIIAGKISTSVLTCNVFFFQKRILCKNKTKKTGSQVNTTGERIHILICTYELFHIKNEF